MIAEAALIGVAAGVVAGLLGVGGGVLFVPALVLLLGLTQREAEATSLLAIVPVALVGAWRQARYGNLALREGLIVGALALPGSLAGVALANVLPERVLRLAFAAFIAVIALRMVRENISSCGPRKLGPSENGVSSCGPRKLGPSDDVS